MNLTIKEQRIEIPEAELREQLAAQGYNVTRKAVSVWAPGMIVWGALEATSDFCCGAQVFHVRNEREKLPDALIRAYEELYAVSKTGFASGGPGSQWVNVPRSVMEGIMEVRKKIDAIKSGRPAE